MALGFQCRADGADAPVHHVAGGDDVHARLGLRQRLTHQHLDRGVVDDVVGLVQQAVLAVAGEGVEGHVGHDAQVGEFLFQGPHHRGHQAVWVGGFDAIGRFQVQADDGEQRHHRDAQLHAVFGHGQQQVQAQSLHAGHGAHGFASALAFQHKHRVDQVMRRDGVFTHQVAGEGIAAQAARTGGGVVRELGGHVHVWDCGKFRSGLTHQFVAVQRLLLSAMAGARKKMSKIGTKVVQGR